MQWIWNYGPVIVWIRGGGGLQSYRGGVYSGSCGTDSDGHFVLVTGYDNRAGKNYWIIKNVSRACMPACPSCRPAQLHVQPPWLRLQFFLTSAQSQPALCPCCLQSWGSSWGSNGYALFPMWSGEGQCAMQRVSRDAASQWVCQTSRMSKNGLLAHMNCKLKQVGSAPSAPCQPPTTIFSALLSLPRMCCSGATSLTG